MEAPKILVADDDAYILEIVSYNLKKQGYEVFTATNGLEAIEQAEATLPNLIILDITMPYKNGIEVCKKLRVHPLFKDTLIIFLTALNDEHNHIKGLETGGDDYIGKPISPSMLISRVNALLRRSKKNSPTPLLVIQIGALMIDPVRFLVTVEDAQVQLAKKEFALLYMLASAPDHVFLRHEILTQVWGEEVVVGERTIDVHIRKIRKKLNVDCIATVKSVGYKFIMK